ncbi:hypothetical protein LTR53_009671 [Teratosphaeriaceae sp. CCFEE 6253]|nr:hypothetical protein LTR53_009671 [Teratosphaeriaceae sp. CCFEE 6253]
MTDSKMVIVRESPRAKLSPDKQPAQWPPQSPFQALLSSPSGRQKWQEQPRSRERDRSMSPSPIKRSSRALQAQVAAAMDEDEDLDAEMQDLDDEEARAALELARIEAKLNLDRIRRKKKLAAAAITDSTSISTSPRKAVSSRTTDIEVPLSPLKHHAPTSEHVSPARKRLGLNVPAKAVEVSLKRARDGTQVVKQPVETPRGQSFNERLRATVEKAEAKEAKDERVDRVRSKGFGIVNQARQRQEAGVLRQPTRTDPEAPRSTAVRPSKPAAISRAGSLRSIESNTHASTLTQDPPTHPARTGPRSTSAGSDSADDNDLISTDITGSASYDPFSSLHLSKRHIPHPTIARALESKKVYTLPRLLKEVKAPHYDPPDCETDFVLFAVLASKSSPYDQKNKNRTTDEAKPQEDAEAPRKKFMVLKLSDLKWEVDCFLFGTAFDQFWKLTPGTLLAILNPEILPPKPGQRDTGRFSLKLGSSEDSVMEVGVARDLGYCSAVRKDGQKCDAWVDKRSTEICEFHLDLFVEKQRRGRMEVNTMFRSHGTGDPMATRGGVRRRGAKPEGQMGVTQSREYGTLYSVPGYGKSAASLLDADDTDRLAGWAEGEASRKRIAAGQRERDLQRQLDKLSSGNESVGADYMRAQGGKGKGSGVGDAAADEAKGLFAKPKAADLGLLGNTAGTAHLSPAKDRKRHFGLGAVGTAGRDAMGWGGAAKYGLLQPRTTRMGSPEKGQTRLDVNTTLAGRPSAIRGRSQDGSRSASPEKKRARFMLAEKGLREPGRESGGAELNRLLRVGDEDDDGLDIV